MTGRSSSPFENQCIFRRTTQEALDTAPGIAWEMSVEAGSARTIEASVAADLAVGQPSFSEPRCRS